MKKTLEFQALAHIYFKANGTILNKLFKTRRSTLCLPQFLRKKNGIYAVSAESELYF